VPSNVEASATPLETKYSTALLSLQAVFNACAMDCTDSIPQCLRNKRSSRDEIYDWQMTKEAIRVIIVFAGD